MRLWIQGRVRDLAINFMFHNRFFEILGGSVPNNGYVGDVLGGDVLLLCKHRGEIEITSRLSGEILKIRKTGGKN